jgi:methylenetetrahydrofolate reductase (NADPH)
VACYPETHQHAASAAADLDNLKRKIDAGAVRAISQCFFDAGIFLRFVERARAAGITVPIVPGIMPVSNFEAVTKFASASGTTIPREMTQLFEGLSDDPEQRHLVGLSWTVGLCRQLRLAGVDEFHFYTLNRAALTEAVCKMLGLEAQANGDAAPLREVVT